MFHNSFLISLNCIFSFFHFHDLWRFINFIDIKKQVCFHWWFPNVLGFQFHWFLLLSKLFLSLCLLWVLISSSFCGFLKWKLRLLIWDFYFFLTQVFHAINFPLSNAFVVITQILIFWCIVFFIFTQFKTLSNFPCYFIFDSWVSKECLS